jgi:hypothetical protein
VEDGGGIFPVLCFDISRGDHAQLLVSFVKLAFRDPGGVSGGLTRDSWGLLLVLLSLYGFFYLRRHFCV